jgi:3-oxoacyl-[acyl-carrier protein] reductase
MGRLSNRIALITGATGAIGSATARIFAKEGADLALSDMAAEGADTLVNELRALGRRVTFTNMDVTSRDQVEAAVRSAEQEFGRIDILVNNAGISIYGAIDAITDPDWHKVIDVNLTGVFLCTQIVVEGMKARRYGRIVNIGSLAGKVGGLLTPFGQMASPSYAASKGGVMAMTKTLAKDLGRYNITVNALAPGPIWTPMIESVNPDLLKFLTDLVPLGRLGQPEDVAYSVAFLASDEASWISGHWLDLDGGMVASA